MMNTNHLNPADEEEDRPYPSFTTFNVLNYIYSATLLISLGLIIGLFVRFYVIDTDILGLAYHYLFMTAIIFGFIWDTVNGVMGWIIVTSEKKLAPLVMFGTAAAVRLCCGIVLYDPGYFIYALVWFYLIVEEKIDDVYHALAWLWIVFAFIRFVLLIVMGVLTLPLGEKVRKFEMSSEGKIYGPARWYRRRNNQGQDWDWVVLEQPQYQPNQNPTASSYPQHTQYQPNQYPTHSSYPSQQMTT